MGMGRGSDTRMYAPRSESDHMHTSANEDETKYNPTSPEDNEKRREEKKLKDEEKKEKHAKLKHLKISSKQGLSGSESPVADDDSNKQDDEREISLQGGPAGSRGTMLDLATGAKSGTGSAMSPGLPIAMSEPMIDAMSSLLKTETHPGSLASYRDMVTDIDDDIPMEQRMSKLRGEALPTHFPLPELAQGKTPPKYTDNVEHLPDIPIINEEGKLHSERNQSDEKDEEEFELLNLFSRPSIRDETVMNDPKAMFNTEDLKGEQYDLMREYDDIPDDLVEDAKELDEPVDREDVYDALDVYGEENLPYYEGIQGKPMRRTYTPNSMERIDMPTFAGLPFNEDTHFTMSEPMVDAMSSLLKTETDKVRESRRRAEKRREFRPSTGQFKKPPGGMDPTGATMRRFRARMRGIKGGKKTGMMKPHLSVEMSHRGIATKQPLSKDPQKYRAYKGQSEARKILGNVRTTFSPHARHSERSVYAGPTGAGRLGGLLPGQAGQLRQPSLRNLSRVRKPRMPRPMQPPTPSPMGMAGLPSLPTPSMQPGMPSSPSSSMMMSEEREQSELLKSRNHNLRTHYINLIRRLIAAKERTDKLSKAGTQSAFEEGAVPAHPAGVQQNEDEEEKNDGPTQNLETNSSRMGLDPAGYLISQRGHMG